MVPLKYLNQQHSCVRVLTSQFWFPNPCVIFWQWRRNITVASAFVLSSSSASVLSQFFCVCYVMYQSGKHSCHISLEPMNTLIFWVQIQEAHIRRHINVQWNILKFKSGLYREDAMGEVEPWFFLLAGARGSLCNSCNSSEEAGKCQSYLTSVGTTLLAMSHALWLMIGIGPQVLCNDPGTCVPPCIIAFLFKVAGIIGHLFFMPRIARLKKLSLSGLLLFKLCIVEQFFVQWRHNYRENIVKLTMLAVSYG